ncbi:unnamed protein product [Orchesella dallaii]|uniref:Uncharacterized protein n=1 Tax=Orchesella dallaii TaxID=48710 RepID=A0ABP1RV71_9HEXA
MATLKEILQLHHQFIFQYLLRLITILIQLGCGIWITTLTAFYNEKPVHFWVYIIFGIYLIFTLWVLTRILWPTHKVYLEMQSRSAGMENNLLNLNNFYICTCSITFCSYFALLVYNSDVLASKTSLNCPYAVLLTTFLGWRWFWPETPFFLVPCAMFIPWIDLGCGFTITIWAAFYNGSKTTTEMWIGYGILGAQCVYAGCLLFYYFIGIWSAFQNRISLKTISIHPVVLASATGTTVCFLVVAFYHVVLLGHESVDKIGPIFLPHLLFLFEQQLVLIIYSLIPKSPNEINEENENGNAVTPVPV